MGVMDPQRNIKGLAVAEIWGKDPVHPEEEIYSKLLRVCWRLSSHAAAVAAATASERRQATAQRRTGAKPTDLSEAEWWTAEAMATTAPPVLFYPVVNTEGGADRVTSFPSTRAPALDGPQGEGEAAVDGATGEVDSAIAIAPMVGAAEGPRW